MAHSWTCVKRPLLQSSASHDSYLPTELVPTFPGQGRLIGLRKGDEVLGELAKLSFFFQPCHPLFWCCQECEVKYYLSNDSS